jgi:hypothetical protein
MRAYQLVAGFSSQVNSSVIPAGVQPLPEREAGLLER